MKFNYRIAFISDEPRLRSLSESLATVSALALDIETINWWDPRLEQVALIQLAYRAGTEVRVSLIDALATLDLTILRTPLELKTATKVIHNAAFDAVRLARHLKIRAAPIHDTMLAARRSGEKRYSLKAQVEQHLGLPLDKEVRQSDWSLRPLSPKQLDYAARDAVAALLLYEHQLARGLSGHYQLRPELADEQNALPLGNTAPSVDQVEPRMSADAQPAADTNLSTSSLALLGIIAELPSRYYPEQLAVCVGAQRVGLAGWIVDQLLGDEADVDEASAKLEIAELCQQGLVRVTPTRRLEASESGMSIWQKYKPA